MNGVRRPVILVIRDGWGENHDASLDKYNAVKLANDPFCKAFRQTGRARKSSRTGLKSASPKA